MRLGGRRVPGSIKYPKKDRGTRLPPLRNTRGRILSRRLTNPDASTTRQRIRDLILSISQLQSVRRARRPDTTAFVSGNSSRSRNSSIALNLGRRTNVEDLLIDRRNWITARSNRESGGLSVDGDNRVAFRRRNWERGDQTMTSQNDSIIWNNRPSDQVESNLSLVVNPPSSLSQHEDSVVSEDSQYTRSSQLDLALEDERRWLKYRIENLTRDECIITCVLAQVCADIMMLSSDELPGSRETIPSDEEAKQSLLYLSYGGCWELNNLRTVLDLTEFLPVGLRRLSGLGVRDRGSASRKLLEGRLEQCLDLTRRLNLHQAG